MEKRAHAQPKSIHMLTSKTSSSKCLNVGSSQCLHLWALTPSAAYMTWFIGFTRCANLCLQNLLAMHIFIFEAFSVCRSSSPRHSRLKLCLMTSSLLKMDIVYVVEVVDVVKVLVIAECCCEASKSSLTSAGQNNLPSRAIGPLVCSLAPLG